MSACSSGFWRNEAHQIYTPNVTLDQVGFFAWPVQRSQPERAHRLRWIEATYSQSTSVNAKSASSREMNGLQRAAYLVCFLCS